MQKFEVIRQKKRTVELLLQHGREVRCRRGREKGAPHEAHRRRSPPHRGCADTRKELLRNITISSPRRSVLKLRIGSDSGIRRSNAYLVIFKALKFIADH